MTNTSTRPRNHRQRGKYAQPEPAGHRTGGRDFGSPNDRPEGEMSYRTRIVRGHGAHGGSHRICYSRESGGSLVIEKNNWIPINEVEFDRLKGEVIETIFYDGERRVVRSLRKFAFETLGGEPVELPEIPDRQIVEVQT